MQGLTGCSVLLEVQGSQYITRELLKIATRMKRRQFESWAVGLDSQVT